MDEDNSLVRRRSRRSTAGNRYAASSIHLNRRLNERVNSMEAALAELTVEDVKDEVEDKDFMVIKGK
jgi:hypothetical protein